MIPISHKKLQELHEKMLDWICEHIKEDENLFHALYGRIECRIRWTEKSKGMPRQVWYPVPT